MGSVSKHSINTSETSSEESNYDHQLEKSKDENTVVGRFYECNFCKRGFTNAQALGGHMNIHRKDRIKAKQKHPKSSSSFSDKSGEEYCMNPRYFEHFSSDHQHYCAVPHHIGGNMINYNHQFYVPTSNPNFSLGYHHLSDSNSPRMSEHSLSLFEDHRTANLSMQIDHQQDSESRKENELDLELRLG